jgi:hypothetical protein
MTKLSPKDIEDHVRWLEVIRGHTSPIGEEMIVEMTDRFTDTFEPKPSYRFSRDKSGKKIIVEERPDE